MARKLVEVGTSAPAKDAKRKSKHDKNNPAVREAWMRKKIENRIRQAWVWDVQPVTVTIHDEESVIPGKGHWEKVAG